MSEIFGGVSEIWGCLKFSGGVSEIFGGPEIFGGGMFLQFLFSFFFNFFSPPKNPSGMHTPRTPRDGQCAASMHPTEMHSCFLKKLLN